MSKRCNFKRGDNWCCGSYAFNLAKEGIEQGELCDRHYWQVRAMEAESAVAMCANLCENMPMPSWVETTGDVREALAEAIRQAFSERTS